jgi:Xaa-Pro aminopeptidase
MFDFMARGMKLSRRLKRGKKIPYMVTSMTDIRYLTGFTGSDGILLILEGKSVLGTDGRYRLQVEEEVSSAEGYVYSRKRDIFRKYLKKGSPLHFDRDTMSFVTHNALVKMGYKMVPLASPLTSFRAVKDQSEIECIEKAAVIGTTAFISSISTMEEEQSERKMAARIEFEMKDRGAEGPSFPPIVAYGCKTAYPHARPGVQNSKGTTLMLFDYGSRYKGYCSDETVTVLKEDGKGNKLERRMFDAVRKAMEGAYSVIRDGVSCREVDRKARGIIEGLGFGDYFEHSTGHGVGLDVHEPPYISSYSREILKAGMVITIEPGVYIKGTGGVRLEDLLVVTCEGYKRLTYLPKGYTIPICA